MNNNVTIRQPSQWSNITIDISKLEYCRQSVSAILDTVKTFSVNDLTLELYCAYYSLGEAIKWLKFFNGDIDIGNLPEMWRGDVHNIYPDRRIENLRPVRR